MTANPLHDLETSIRCGELAASGQRDCARDEDPAGDFVAPGSVVRRIWGNSDVVLLIFAGSAAEFALNRAVDWLFFTGGLPADPLGRLLSTAAYAQQIVFADRVTAAGTLARIRAIHQSVETRRGRRIPDWAHRDVLYMLVDYSERAYGLLAGPLTPDERNELYDVFRRVGDGLAIPELPPVYEEWRRDRALHLRRDLERGEGTGALYARYRASLGGLRYALLLKVQALLVPDHVRDLLRLKRVPWMRAIVRVYPLFVRAGLGPLISALVMPRSIRAAIRALDRNADRSVRGAAPG